MDFNGKTVIITGASSGIGKGIAGAFSQRGANIVIGDINDESSDSLCEELGRNGSKVVFVKTDVTNQEDCRNLVKVAVEKFGKIDVGVNNAGISSMYRVEELPADEWDRVMAVNARGIFLCSQAELIQFKKQNGGGKIVNTASIAGKRAAYFMSHYVASKFAVIGFTKNLALEAAPHNISVNCICPGLVQTDMQKREIKWESSMRGITEEELRKEYLDITPMKRLETTADVANLVLFLASEYADFITGEAIDVTGGLGLTC